MADGLANVEKMSESEIKSYELDAAMTNPLDHHPHDDHSVDSANASNGILSRQFSIGNLLYFLFAGIVFSLATWKLQRDFSNIKDKDIINNEMIKSNSGFSNSTIDIDTKSTTVTTNDTFAQDPIRTAGGINEFTPTVAPIAGRITSPTVFPTSSANNNVIVPNNSVAPTSAPSEYIAVVSIAVPTDAPSSADTSIVTTTPNLASSSPVVGAATTVIVSPTTITTPEQHRGCLHGDTKRSDRLAHGESLYRGQFVCSTKGRYRMGLDDDGNFVWRDDEEDVTKLVASGGYRFELTKTGVFMLYNAGGPIWAADSGQSIRPQGCLTDYACPYLHLHNAGGMILNYIDGDGRWIARKVHKVYGFPW